MSGDLVVKERGAFRTEGMTSPKTGRTAQGCQQKDDVRDGPWPAKMRLSSRF